MYAIYKVYKDGHREWEIEFKKKKDAEAHMQELNKRMGLAPDFYGFERRIEKV